MEKYDGIDMGINICHFCKNPIKHCRLMTIVKLKTKTSSVWICNKCVSIVAKSKDSKFVFVWKEIVL